MACSLTVTGRSLPCRDALGGVKKVWIGNWTDGIWGAVGTTTDGLIDDATAALTLHDFVSPKNTSSLTQTVNASVENGTVFYTQVLSLVCNKPVSLDVEEIKNLAKGRLAIVVQDNNDNYFVIGHTRGAELTGGSLTTGTAIGDLNGFTLEFTGEEGIPAPFLDEAGANLTFEVTT